MSLLRQIQEAAVSADSPITDLLRRCKILSMRLQNADFTLWVERELNGYPDNDVVPEYRHGEVPSFGTFVGVAGSGAQNVPLPPSCVPEQYRSRITDVYMLEPIGVYEDLLRKDSSTFKAPWPADLIRLVSGSFYQHMNLVGASQQIPRGMIVRLVDSVRNRVLTFALEIEQMNPEAGEAAGDTPPVTPERVQQIFQNVVYGNVANIASASTGFTQTATVSIAQNDFAALSKELEKLGVTTEDIGELRKTIDEGVPDDSGMGNATRRWLGTVLAKAGNGALKVSITTAANILPKLLAQYLGLPPG